jgi:hypothetical protein
VSLTILYLERKDEMNSEISKVVSKIESMLNQYSPEYDVRPGPRISCVEMDLANMIGILANEILDLKNEIETLKRG